MGTPMGGIRTYCTCVHCTHQQHHTHGYSVIPWCQWNHHSHYHEWLTVVVLSLCFLCSPACEQLLTAVAAEGVQGQYGAQLMIHIYSSSTWWAVACQHGVGCSVIVCWWHWCQCHGPPPPPHCLHPWTTLQADAHRHGAGAGADVSSPLSSHLPSLSPPHHLSSAASSHLPMLSPHLVFLPLVFLPPGLTPLLTCLPGHSHRLSASLLLVGRGHYWHIRVLMLRSQEQCKGNTSKVMQSYVKSIKPLQSL